MQGYFSIAEKTIGSKFSVLHMLATFRVVLSCSVTMMTIPSYYRELELRHQQELLLEDDTTLIQQRVEEMRQLEVRICLQFDYHSVPLIPVNRQMFLS